MERLPNFPNAVPLTGPQVLVFVPFCPSLPSPFLVASTLYTRKAQRGYQYPRFGAVRVVVHPQGSLSQRGGEERFFLLGNCTSYLHSSAAAPPQPASSPALRPKHKQSPAYRAQVCFYPHCSRPYPCCMSVSKPKLLYRFDVLERSAVNSPSVSPTSMPCGVRRESFP